MFDVIVDSVKDILAALPILLVVYAFLYFVETRLQSVPRFLEKTQRIGPVFGALAGAVPQCGFSAAAATLYMGGWLAPATLVSVFISTSDEAIPVLLANPSAGKNILLLIFCKVVLAIVGGYVLHFTLFRHDSYRHEKTTVNVNVGCNCCTHGPIRSIATRTFKTTLYLLVTMLLINLAVYFVGTETLSQLLLSGSLLQPALCALIGLIPGCAISVLLTELFVSGTISVGAVIAGLSTGAGFGYTLLLSAKGSRKNAWRIIGATYLIAVIGGTALDVFLR